MEDAVDVLDQAGGAPPVGDPIGAGDLLALQQRIDRKLAVRPALEPEAGEVGKRLRSGGGCVDRQAPRRKAVLIERIGAAEIGRALESQPVALLAAVHRPKAGEDS